MPGVDKDPEREMVAAPDWGDDVNPETEQHLEFLYSRVFSAYHADPEIREFDDPQEIAEDASVYPRRESEITDFDQWTKIKRPLVPSLAFDIEMGEAPDPDMWDVIRVPSGSDDRGLEIVERDGAVPLSELCEREDNHDRVRRDRSSGPLPEF